MMDREAFNRWCKREAERIEAAGSIASHRWEYYVAEMQERFAPPVSPEIEAFCESTMRRNK